MSPAVTSLRRQGSAVALLGFGGLALLAVSQPIWLVGSMVIWAYCLYLLFRSLEENIREGESAPLASLGWPTLVTLVRGILLAVVAGFLFTPMPLGVRAYVPAGATGVILEMVATATDNKYGVRKNGSFDTWMSALNTAKLDTHAFFMIRVDADRIFEVYTQDTAVKTYLLGYTMPGVTFFTDAYNKSVSAGTLAIVFR